MKTFRLIPTVVLSAALVGAAAGCSIGPFAGGLAATARPCAAAYRAERCEAMLTLAAERLNVADADVTSIAIAPPPTPRPDGVLETRGGARPLVVLAQMGPDPMAVREVEMCGGLPSGPACMDDPAWAIGTSIGNGYGDVPCAGEPPAGCATPVPARDQDAIAAASALRIADRVIAVPGVGHQEVRIGEATLPNGVLTVAHADLVDPWPDGVRFSSDGIRLEIRSLVPGRPGFMNIHEHGWYPGTEAVEVLLVFDARRADPGATIEIRDLIVG